MGFREKIREFSNRMVDACIRHSGLTALVILLLALTVFGLSFKGVQAVEYAEWTVNYQAKQLRKQEIRKITYENGQSYLRDGLDQLVAGPFDLIFSDCDGGESEYYVEFGHGYTEDAVTRFVQNGKYGFLSMKTGEILIEARYAMAEPMVNRSDWAQPVSLVSTGEESFFIDATENTISLGRYVRLTQARKNYYYGERSDGLVDLVTFDGKVILTGYEKLRLPKTEKKGYIGARQNGRFQLIRYDLDSESYSDEDQIVVVAEYSEYDTLEKVDSTEGYAVLGSENGQRAAVLLKNGQILMEGSYDSIRWDLLREEGWNSSETVILQGIRPDGTVQLMRLDLTTLE